MIFLKNFLFLKLHCVTWGILAPQPGIEPRPSEAKALSSNHRLTGKFPKLLLFCANRSQFFINLGSSHHAKLNGWFWWLSTRFGCLVSKTKVPPTQEGSFTSSFTLVPFCLLLIWLPWPDPSVQGWKEAGAVATRRRLVPDCGEAVTFHH